MDSKLVKLCVIAALCMGFSACDDNESNEEPATCKNQCMGNLSLQCSADGSVSAVDCSASGGCDEVTGLCKTNPVIVGCLDGQVKCDSNVEWVCSDGQWVIGNYCLNGCNGNVCASAKEPVCVVGTSKCENNIAYFCVSGGEWYQTQVCPNGCNQEKGICNAGGSQNSCSAGQTQCAGSFVQNCVGGTWVNDSVACENGCSNGKCNPSAYTDPCIGVTCTKGTCDKGVCVTDDMKTAKDGDPCDPYTFSEFCNGSSSVFCSSEGTVVYTDCANDGGCAMVSEEYEGEVYVSAWCNGPADQCKAENQEITYCKEDDELGIYESYYVCAKNTEGSYTAMDMLLYGDGWLCDACNADYSACEGGGEQTGCDYETKCDGNVLYECMDLSILGMGVYEDSYDCSEDGMACSVVGGVANCRETCSAASEPKKSCDIDDYYGNEVSLSSACVKGDDNKYYVEVSSTDCSADCVAGECRVLDPKDGTECSEADVDYCNGDVLMTCFWGIVWMATSCSYEYGSDYTCVAGANGVPDCMVLCSAADVGNKMVECSYDDYSSVSIESTYVCSKVSDTVYAYTYESEKYCNAACVADGSSCDSNGYMDLDDTIYDCSDVKLQSGTTAGDYCKSEDPSYPVALCVPCNEYEILGCGTNDYIGQHSGLDYCDFSTLTSDYYLCPDEVLENGQTGDVYCQGKYGSSSVAVCDDEYIYCMDSCSKEGDQIRECDVYEEGTYATYVSTCSDLEGKLVYIVDYSASYLCDSTCNADSTDCK